MNESLAGKSILSQLNNRQKSLNIKLKQTEKSLKEEEIKLVSQKNILVKEEFEKKVNILKKKITNYNKENIKLKKELEQKKINAQSILVKNLTNVISEYAKKNSISIVFPKKNILIGKTELDITKDIIINLDKLINEIKLN